MNVMGPLPGPDPQIALISPVVPTWPDGPVHRVQYVIELVGPRSLPASAANQLLSDEWFSALGKPELFCMAAMDQAWRRLKMSSNGSYDSLAVCWDIVSPQGVITRRAAEHLLQQLEQFATAVGRKAIPLPSAQEVDRAGRDLLKIRDQLDIGVSLAVMAKSGRVPELDLWEICARLGLQLSAEGSYDWTVDGISSPLLSVTPIGQTEAFSREAMQNGTVHEGVTVGFSVPFSPAPLAALDGAMKASYEIAKVIIGVVLDDQGREITPALADEMRRTLQAAIEAFDRIGIKTGSPAALKLFSSVV